VPVRAPAAVADLDQLEVLARALVADRDRGGTGPSPAGAAVNGRCGARPARGPCVRMERSGDDVPMPDRSHLGLPDQIEAGLFDMDGVLTQTAKVHAAAWKQMFDEFLQRRATATGEAFRPFDIGPDYEAYVDGKPRYDGVRDFLASRGIELPHGAPDDPPDAQTVTGLGNRKNDLVQKLIRDDGVEAYEGSVRYVKAARDAGLRTAVVSSSKNTAEVLQVAGIADLFDDVVDGHAVEDRGLAGKPAPDTFLQAARELGVEPARAAVFEDALAGVEAGRAGRFGLVVGVNRADEADALREHGADVVVDDLADLLGAS
jgi:beta-phosphoglucomutase family hydrolase